MNLLCLRDVGRRRIFELNSEIQSRGFSEQTGSFISVRVQRDVNVSAPDEVMSWEDAEGCKDSETQEAVTSEEDFM